MAGAVDLPEVVQNWTANVSDYVAAMGEMLAATKAVAEEVDALQKSIDMLHGKTIDIGLDTTGAAAAAATAAAVNNLADAEWKANAAGRLQIETSRLLAETDAMVAEREDMVTAAIDDRARAAKTAVIVDQLETENARGMALALGETAIAADKSGAAATRAWQPWFLFGNTWQTALHWIVAGSAEFLAVAIPAAIALGAGLMVAAQGAQNAQEHFSSLYTATEATANMFHTTVGDTLGLGHALQSAQNAANPGVYEILGSAVNDAKTGFSSLASVGLQVVHMFDEFSARVTVDLKGGMGTQLQGLLSGMVRDLQEFGQILGNVGHALLNFASDMPGLAHVLLTVADGISHVILWVSELPRGLILGAMALEEFFRWGGLVTGMLVRLTGATAAMDALGAGNFITRFGAGLLALVQRGGQAISFIGRFIGALGEEGGALASAGAAIDSFGFDLTMLGATAAPLAAAGIAAFAGGLVALIIYLNHVKSPAQQMVDSMQAIVAKASNLQVLGDASQNIAKLGTTMDNTSRQVEAGGARIAGGIRVANPAFQTFNAGLVQQVGDIKNTVAGADLLARTYHISVPAAMALADEAGVKLVNGITGQGQAAVIARQQIANLVQGYKAMGQPMGAVGTDMTALAIQAGLANTRVSQLNQAWDQFMQTLTGGTSGMAAFATSLQNIGTGIAHVQNNLGQGNQFSQSIKQFATDLQTFGKNGAQAWQNFDQVVGSTAPQLIDWLRTAGAEGAISGKQFSTAVLAMGSALVPLASKSKTAQAEVLGLVQQAGLGIHTWGQLTAAINSGHVSMGELAKIVDSTTQKMSNMSQVAKNLGTVLSSQVTQAVDAAKLSASGLSTNLDKLAQDMAHGGAQSATYNGDLNKVIESMMTLHQSDATIAASLQAVGIHITAAGVAAIISAGHLHAFGSAQATAGAEAVRAAAQINAEQQAINGLHSKTITITTIQQYITAGHRDVGAGGYQIFHQHGGIIPGYSPGRDIVPAMLSPGEGILNPYAVRMLGHDFVHWANAAAERGGGVNPAALRTGGSGGFGGGGGSIGVQVFIDGKETFGNNKVRVLQYGTRNAGSRTGVWKPT